MQDLVFLNDTDPDALITNPIDFFDRKKLISALRICEAPEENNKREIRSDYELFCSLIEHRAVMPGHRQIMFFDYLLKHVFSVNLSTFCGNCKEIWSKCVDNISQNRITISSLERSLNLRRPAFCVSDRQKFAHVDSPFVPMLNANSFIRTAARDWNTWEQEMCTALEQYNCAEKTLVYVSLPMNYSFKMPSLYEVNQTLGEPIHRRNSNLLLSQIFRFFAERKGKYSLILRVECAPDEAISLLSKIETSIGLPNVLWVTPYPHTRDALLEFTQEKHDSRVECGLFTSDYPSKLELDCALEAYSARYPAAHLHVFSGCDVRYHVYERSRLTERIKE